MRQVLSISLPATEVRRIRTIAKRQGHRSMSAYVHHLLKTDQDIMSDTELLKRVREARKEYRAGKAIKARSMADLL
ncbi:hypothetical protein EXS71_01940 [Candidatus Uhrbacteria bacterium]|nr:hypothetical protein [Candidatus Uhrbacteria bacterium]